MTVETQPRTSGSCTCVDSERSERSHLNKVPLTEERFAILGHEIRNPLSALSAALQAWPSTTVEPQLTEDLLQIMRRQVTQLTRLCNDLLDTASIAHGKLSINRVSVDIGQVIQNACEEIRPFVDQCGHTMKVELSRFPLKVVGDESRLTQVFANLLHNSAKFTDRNGQLDISLERHNDTVVVRLRDNGQGIRADRLQKIFLADNGAKTLSECAGEGLGIGLRLAKAIVELHGGTVEAFSEGLGHGSTFVVTLPIVTEMPTDRSTLPSSSIETNRTHAPQVPHHRIVVVDDDRSLRYLMSRLLQKLGQSVMVADSGDKALQIILQCRPQVVFLDLQMHGMSGFEVARKIRSRIELNSVALIALSGHADAASRRLAAESGFDQYLVKPTSMDDLTDVLSRIGELSSC